MDLLQSEKGSRIMDSKDEYPIPGTVYLVDKEFKSDSQHSTVNPEIILFPTPSHDPEDPLNWSRKRKLLSTVCTCSYVLLLGISTAAIYSVIVPVSKATGLSINELNQGTGYMFLLLGWSCLLWQPMALKYGKRLAYIVSLIGTIAVMIWQPHTKTSGQYLASKILQGFFGAPIESLCEMSLSDIWFQHERGKFLALYGFLLGGSNYLAPLLMGFINDRQGWQWVFYWSAIFCGISLVFNFFFMEETNWSRISDTTVITSTTTMSGLDHPTYPEKNLQPTVSCDGLNRHSDDSTISQKPVTSSKTFVQKMSLLPRKQPLHFWKTLIRPILYFSLPAVTWSGFSYGLSLLWANVMNATASKILTAAPYRFSASQVGLTYIAPLVGAVISALYAGNFGDWFALRMARRNRGVMEAEHRLWLFGISCLLMPFALTLWGVGAAHHVHWFGLIFALFIKGLQSSLGISLSVTYTLDSYRGIGGEAIVTVILIRNTMSFAMNFAITPWLLNTGLQDTFIVAAIASLVGFLTFLPMIHYGKKLRDRSARRYWRYVEEEKALGLFH